MGAQALHSALTDYLSGAVWGLTMELQGDTLAQIKKQMHSMTKEFLDCRKEIRSLQANESDFRRKLERSLESIACFNLAKGPMQANSCYAQQEESRININPKPPGDGIDSECRGLHEDFEDIHQCVATICERINELDIQLKDRLRGESSLRGEIQDVVNHLEQEESNRVARIKQFDQQQFLQQSWINDLAAKMETLEALLVHHQKDDVERPAGILQEMLDDGRLEEAQSQTNKLITQLSEFDKRLTAAMESHQTSAKSMEEVKETVLHEMNDLKSDLGRLATQTTECQRELQQLKTVIDAENETCKAKVLECQELKTDTNLFGEEPLGFQTLTSPSLRPVTHVGARSHFTFQQNTGSASVVESQHMVVAGALSPRVMGAMSSRATTSPQRTFATTSPQRTFTTRQPVLAVPVKGLGAPVSRTTSSLPAKPTMHPWCAANGNAVCKSASLTPIPVGNFSSLATSP